MISYFASKPKEFYKFGFYKHLSDITFIPTWLYYYMMNYKNEKLLASIYGFDFLLYYLFYPSYQAIFKHFNHYRLHKEITGRENHLLFKSVKLFKEK